MLLCQANQVLDFPADSMPLSAPCLEHFCLISGEEWITVQAISISNLQVVVVNRIDMIFDYSIKLACSHSTAVRV